MACMEHLCVNCGEIQLNNVVRYHTPCPKCGNTRWASCFDEELELNQANIEREDDYEQEDLDCE